MKSKLLLFALLFASLHSFAQPFNLTGRVLDAADTSALIGVTVIIKSTTDSTIPTNGGVSDADGNISISGINPGTYSIKLNYVGYSPITQTITFSTADVSLGTVKMANINKELKGVTIKDKQTRATQLGDTSQFNADAYKTHPDATAEDLVGKMPGVTSDNNGVKVNGETVQQVYVDGKPFFGTDPSAALKNLPAEIIDKIQIFDKLSDQSSFTGFDDGSSQKTMNIITKGSKREGVFGKVYAGYGTDDRYSAGGNVNFFNGDRRISLVGMSNNINQQNFSAQDLLGVTSGSGGGNRGGGGGGRGSFGGGGGASNFFVGQSNGITNTNSGGINYSDNWGKKLKVSGSYFYNNTDNNSLTDLTQNYFRTDVLYHEYDTSESNNTNHRANLRFEYTIDSANSIVFTPGVSFQNNSSHTGQFSSRDIDDSAISRTRNYNSADNSGYSSSNNLLIQHKFRKQRRTISLNINATLNEKSGTGTYRSDNVSFTDAVDSLLYGYDQRFTIKNTGYNISPNLTYTEPVGKAGQLMFTYNPSWSKSTADKETFDRDSATSEYTNFNNKLSNKYFNTYNTQRGGLSYRVGDKKMTFSVGANMQYAMLDGQQTFPYNTKVERDFTSVLPTAMYNYKYTDGRNLRIMYRTNTVAPSVTQLQNVVDITNPLLLKTGNPDLQQDYEHTLIVRYGLTKSKTQRNFFLNLYGTYINNYIGNATLQPLNDSIYRSHAIVDSIRIPSGSQLTLPVNLDGYFNERAFATYSLPLQFIKSNLNLSAGLNYTRSPSMINNQINYSNNTAPSAGVVVSSNISSNLDFTLSYSGSKNFVTNTLQTQANNSYYSHVASFKINYIIKNIVINTNITNNYYGAYSGVPEQNYFLWNAYVGYKMLKSKALEARITAFDILNQNRSVTRTANDIYVENNNTTVLKQYFMFQLTYTIRNFKGTMPTLDDGADKMRGPGGPDGPRPGGFGGPGGPPRGGQ